MPSSARIVLYIAIVSGVLIHSPSPVVATTESADPYARLKSLKPATLEGAREVSALYATLLNQAPFSPPANLIASCERYLKTARQALAHDVGLTCSEHVTLELASASCALHVGSTDKINASMARLTTRRCDAGLGGLEAAVRLAERWFRGDLVATATRALDPTDPVAKRLQDRVGVIMNRTRRLQEALGQSGFGAYGGLYVASVGKGSPAARAGIREGDVIASVAAQPARTPSALASVLEARTTRRTPVLIYRAGQRRQLAWPGRSLGAISMIPLPEALPPSSP